MGGGLILVLILVCVVVIALLAILVPQVGNVTSQIVLELEEVPPGVVPLIW